MTKNDFPPSLHKERQVQGHSCCGRLMALPDVGTLERVTSPWCSSPCWKRTKQPSEETQAEMLIHHCMQSKRFYDSNEQKLRDDKLKVCQRSNNDVFAGNDTLKAMPKSLQYT